MRRRFDVAKIRTGAPLEFCGRQDRLISTGDLDDDAAAPDAVCKLNPLLQRPNLSLHFIGAKAALLCDDLVLTNLRDDCPDLAWSAWWDLPGGGREGEESNAKARANIPRIYFGRIIQLRAFHTANCGVCGLGDRLVGFAFGQPGEGEPDHCDGFPPENIVDLVEPEAGQAVRKFVAKQHDQSEDNRNTVKRIGVAAPRPNRIAVRCLFAFRKEMQAEDRGCNEEQSGTAKVNQILWGNHCSGGRYRITYRLLRALHREKGDAKRPKTGEKRHLTIGDPFARFCRIAAICDQKETDPTQNADQKIAHIRVVIVADRRLQRNIRPR